MPTRTLSASPRLHKGRLKYETILRTQPMPTIEQVGPRGLLQYGSLSPSVFTSLLFWRKWFYDIDNRAAQETGYIFEPIIANAIGGTPAPSKKSPVKRVSDNRKGRQVDCIREKKAYELKLRVTIAASGQGRWKEELDFPADCKASGFTPVLVVLDSTPNDKLAQLEKAFNAQGGEVYIGEYAWNHLEKVAGQTMAKFLEQYVREPLKQLLDEVRKELPRLVAEMKGQNIKVSIGTETLTIQRTPRIKAASDDDEMPDDVTDQLPRHEIDSSTSSRSLIRCGATGNASECRVRNYGGAVSAPVACTVRGCVTARTFDLPRAWMVSRPCLHSGALFASSLMAASGMAARPTFRTPRTNTAWWAEKIEANRNRDKQ